MGPWQTAALDSSNTKYSWKLFTYRWENATPGEHTLVSRVTDVNGTAQPVAAHPREENLPKQTTAFPRKAQDRLIRVTPAQSPSSPLARFVRVSDHNIAFFQEK